MKDNSDIPLPLDQLRTRVLVFAIIDETVSQYQQISKGYVELSTDSDQKNNTFHYLQVKDEKTNQVLMRSNLKLDNNFGKQKGTIISWTDQQQPQYPQIALSFQKDRQCDMLWRTICQKIGKNYLQINGKEKLQTPNSDNLNFILEKAKNNIDLVDYNIVHSKSVMQGLRQLFYQMKSSNDQMGMGIISRIITTIMSPSYSLNAIQTLLSENNFYLLLDVQNYKKGINFKQIYDLKIGNFLINKFNLPKQIFNKIEISHRSTFYRQNVLQLGQQSQLQSIMLMICKQAQVQIISYLNKTKFFQNWKNQTEVQNVIAQPTKIQQQIDLSKQNSNSLPISQQQKNQRIQNKIKFIHQSLIMYQHITSQQIRATFKQNIYTSGILTFIKSQMQQNNHKVMQILYYICEIDKIKFFQFLIQDFKKKSSDNLLKTIMKKFINQPEFINSILSLIESFSSIFNIKKQCFDFFNGTFLCSIFSIGKDLKSILFLTNILLTQLESTLSLFNQLIKSKIFEKLVSQYRNGSTLKTKWQQLELIKLLKHVIIQQAYKNDQKHRQIQKNVIQTGYFDICLMIYMKHSQRYNIISSSMLQNFKIIQKMQYTNFDSYLIKQYSQNQTISKILQPIRKKHIQYINKNINKNMIDQYVQIQQYQHQQILQNQQQDQYLMNDQIQFKTENIIKNNILIQQKEQENHLSSETNDQVRKQNYLEYLKRIINQVKEDDQEFIQSQPRKIIKKQQNHIQTQQNFEISLNF